MPCSKNSINKIKLIKYLLLNSSLGWILLFSFHACLLVFNPSLPFFNGFSSSYSFSFLSFLRLLSCLHHYSTKTLQIHFHFPCCHFFPLLSHSCFPLYSFSLLVSDWGFLGYHQDWWHQTNLILAEELGVLITCHTFSRK